MRPSGVTPVASTIIMPAPEHAYWPRCIRCQSVMRPACAEYWHIGDTTMGLGKVTPPSWIGVNSFGFKAGLLSGCGDRNVSFRERLAQLFREVHRAGLVAVQQQRTGEHGKRLAGQAGDVAVLDHRQRLLHRLRGVLDHPARPLARRERAVVRVAAVGEDFADGVDAELSRDFIVFTSG